MIARLPIEPTPSAMISVPARFGNKLFVEENAPSQPKAWPGPVPRPLNSTVRRWETAAASPGPETLPAETARRAGRCSARQVRSAPPPSPGGERSERFVDRGLPCSLGDERAASWAERCEHSFGDRHIDERAALRVVDAAKDELRQRRAMAGRARQPLRDEPVPDRGSEPALRRWRPRAARHRCDRRKAR